MTALWEHSSAGRASALQAEGHRFEPCCSHHTARQFSWLERQPVTLEVDGSSPFRVAILFFLPLQLSWQSRGLKILVSLVRFRPEAPFCGCSSSGRAPPCQGGGSEFEPRHPLHKALAVASAFFMTKLYPRVQLSWSEYLLDMQGVGGSSPLILTKEKSVLVRERIFLCVIHY